MQLNVKKYYIQVILNYLFESILFPTTVFESMQDSTCLKNNQVTLLLTKQHSQGTWDRSKTAQDHILDEVRLNEILGAQMAVTVRDWVLCHEPFPHESRSHISGQIHRLMYCFVGLSPLARWVWEGEMEGRKVLVWKEDYWAVLFAASQDALFTDMKSIINLHYFFYVPFIVHPNISVVLIAHEFRDSQ